MFNNINYEKQDLYKEMFNRRIVTPSVNGPQESKKRTPSQSYFGSDNNSPIN
jgi:hypothetical protein